MQAAGTFWNWQGMQASHELTLTNKPYWNRKVGYFFNRVIGRRYSRSFDCARIDLPRTIDHFTYYCLGSQGGKLWVAMRLLGPIVCRKVCRNTAETWKTISLSFWIVGFQVQLFLPTIGLDAATSSPLTGLRSIVLPLELNVRVRWRRRSSLPSQTLVLPLQLPSRKVRQVREELAEAGKQIEEHEKREEEMERLIASSNVRMPAQKLRSRTLSFENVKGNDD